MRRPAPILLPLALSAALVATDVRETASQPAPPAEAPIAARLRELVAASGVASPGLGVSVVDIGSGRILFSHNPALPLNPASNAKIATAIAALSALHPEYRWLTAVHGRSSGGVIAGSVTLKGYGDPTLDTAGLLGLAHELRSEGIRRVDGGVVADDTFFDRTYTPGQAPRRGHHERRDDHDLVPSNTVTSEYGSTLGSILGSCEARDVDPALRDIPDPDISPSDAAPMRVTRRA